MSSNFFVVESDGSRLLHYGVKGMQWGVRNAHPSYSSSQQQIDRKSYGKSGVKRINQNLKRGESHPEALKSEASFRLKRKALIITGGIAAIHILGAIGPQVLSELAAHQVAKTTARGATAAANVMANTRGLPGGGFINLSFNSAKNVWE